MCRILPGLLLSLGPNTLPSLVALELDLSSALRGSSGCAFLPLVFWALRSRERNPSAPPFPPVPVLPVLLYSGCCNKAPPTSWLKTTEMYSQGRGGQKSEIQVWAGPSEMQGRTPVSFWGWLPVLSAPGLAVAVTWPPPWVIYV